MSVYREKSISYCMSELKEYYGIPQIDWIMEEISSSIFLLHVEPAQESIILAKMLTHGAEFSVYVNGPQKYSQNYPVLTC